VSRTRSFARRFSAIAVLVGLVASSSGALADPSKEDVARADALFREAQSLVQKGQVSEGCAKFVESQRLDPANGTLLNMAVCHDKEGKFATAYREFQELLQNIGSSKTADDRERTRLANDRLKALDKKITRLSFDVSEIPREAVITLDAERVNDPSAPILIDPGSHTVDVSALQKKPLKKPFEVKEPGPMTLKLEPLADDLPPPPPPVEKAPPPPTELGGFWSTRRILGATVALVGLAGVGVGIGFGIDTFNERDLRDSYCRGTVCNNVGIFYNDQAQQSATISTIGFIAGGALLAIGTVLFITAPRKPPPTPLPVEGAAGVSLGVGPNGMAVRGTF
jgi:hypothetical protein